MNLIVIFVILIITVMGLGAIWYVTSRAECVVPDTNNCPDNQAYYCSSSDAQPSCEDVNKVCGDWPSGFDYTKCGTIDCQYDTDSKKYIWKCNGTPTGGGNIPKGSACTITDGLLDQNTLKGNSLENNKIPASNSLSYYHDTTYNGCRLDQCATGYDAYPAGTGSYLCIPTGMINVQNTACTNYIPDNDYDTGPNNNFDWVNTYIDPTVYGGLPQLACKEYRCAGTIDTTKKPYTCTKSDPTIGSDYPIGGDSHIASWENVSGIGCQIKSCDGQGEWILPDAGDADLVGKNARCHPNCTINVPPGSVLAYDRTTNSCKVASCTDGWTLNGNHCEPDCSTQANIINFLFKGTTPVDQKGFVYKAIPTQDANNNWICVPTQATQANPFGGCGDMTHTAYAVNQKNGTATYCSPSLNGNSAKFNDGTNKGDMGCLACQPRVCPPWATTLNDCVGDVENDCAYDDEFKPGDTSEYDPVQTCVDQNKNRVSIWSVFGDYIQTASLTDPASYNKGTTIINRMTTGIPFIYTTWRLFVKADGSRNNHVDPYTSDIGSKTLEIPNFSVDNDQVITFWTYLDIGHSSGKAPIKVSEMYASIRDNYIGNAPDTSGNPNVTIVLKSGVSGISGTMSVNYLQVGSRTFSGSQLKAPFDFNL